MCIWLFLVVTYHYVYNALKESVVGVCQFKEQSVFTLMSFLLNVNTGHPFWYNHAVSFLSMSASEKPDSREQPSIMYRVLIASSSGSCVCFTGAAS